MSRLLVAVDFSPWTEPLLETAASYAQRLGAEVLLVHVTTPEPSLVGYKEAPLGDRDKRTTRLRDERARLQDAAHWFREQGVSCTPYLFEGTTVETILDHARQWRVDLLVLGSHGRGALRSALLGSVSQAVLRHAPCPLLIVPPSLVGEATPSPSA